jgi:hypothetical protein
MEELVKTQKRKVTSAHVWMDTKEKIAKSELVLQMNKLKIAEQQNVCLKR